MAGRVALVGREEELAQVATALADPDLGGVVLSGPGGVGKTRLGEECLRIGEAAGIQTARVTATASAREIPLGALTSLLAVVPEDTNVLVAARRALSQRADGKRWILMVDDAHLLDAASAALLQAVAGERTVFVVATVRAGEPAPDAIVSLWKDEHARRLDIEPLGDDVLASLASGFVGGPLEPGAEHTLCGLAQGNPLALRELVTGAVREGALREQGGTWRLDGRVPVTDRLTELIARRLDTLTADERAALELVSLGEPLELDVATSMIDPKVAETLEQERLIQVRDDRGGLEVWLGHPLHGEILRERLPVLRRRRIVRDLATAMRDRAGTDRTSLLRLAQWRLELGETGDAELFASAARWARLAGDLPSVVAFAGPVWVSTRQPAVGAMLGHALAWTGRLDEGGEVLDDVLAMRPEGPIRCFAAVCRSEAYVRGRDIAAAMRVSDEQGSGLASPWREEVLTHRGWLLLMAGREGDALAQFEPIMTGEHERPRVIAGLMAAAALPYLGRPVDAVELTRRLRPVQRALWEREPFATEPLGYEIIELTAMTYAGMLDESEARGRQLYQATMASRLGGERAGSLALMLGHAAVVRGRLDDGLEWYRRAAEHYAQQGPEAFGWMAVIGTVSAAAQRGDVGRARAAEARLRDFEIPGVDFARGDALVARGWLRCLEGDTADARELWNQAIADSVRRGRLLTAVDGLHGLARAGLLDKATTHPHELRDRVQGPLVLAKLDHAEAQLAGDPALLMRAATAFEDVGATLLAAEAFLDASRHLRRRGDQRAATQASRRGHELAADCPGAATPALRTTDEVVPLTRRERELALLAADGLSTKEIAERLVLSDRTVQNHLNHAYEKLGVSGRRELRKALRLPTTGRP